MASKLEKIEQEMQKIQGKIAEQQNRLKKLEELRIEQENLKIIQAVRAMRLTKGELAALISGNALPTQQLTKKKQEDENE